jgi:hypothetical protein
MNYYLRIVPTQSGLSTQVWKIDERTAVRVGISNPESGGGTYYFQAEPSETIWDALRRMTPWFKPGGQCPFHKTVLKPGEYYRRMARPIDQHPHEAPGWSPGARLEADTMAITRGQLTALTRQLDRICQTVHPTQATFAAFGHDIRNLLILACTEAESHWRGVLVANGVTRDRFSTNDYVKLCAAMRLDSYAVSFPSYPWLAPVKPFAGWGSTGKPSQELGWYDAYNAVKHNRENEFERGTLEHVFAAVTACAVMMVAQFGLPAGLGQQSELRAFFDISAAPSWPLSDVYIYPYGEGTGDWAAVPYPFEASGA